MEMIKARGGLNNVVQVPSLAANNLLQKLLITNNQFCHKEAKKETEQEDKDIELTLGLSLNGQFGTDPRSRKRKNFELGRSFSIPEGFVFDKVGHGVSDMFQLDRTRSLPVDTETETEFKRRRSEKTRAFMEFPVQTTDQTETKKSRAFLDFQVPLQTKVKNSNQTETKKTRAFLDFQVPLPTKVKNTNQTETKKTRAFMEFNQADTKNTRAFMEFQIPTPTTIMKKNVEVVSGKEKARNILEDMPCVSTRDVGTNGKRVEGFLYWYGSNKEEVKIVCACHGSFLSPTEFVKHGGVTVSDDGDVNVNPLRHIVVKLPNSSL